MKVPTYRVAAVFAATLGLSIAHATPQAAVAATHNPVKASCSTAGSSPARIESFAADRPQIAIEQGLYGTTVLRVDLDAAGNLQHASVLESSGAPVLDTAAITAAHNARFVAESHGCDGVAGSYRATIDFVS